MSRHIPESREEEFAYQFEDDVKELLRIADKGERAVYLNQLKTMKIRMATYEDLMWLPYIKRTKG